MGYTCKARVKMKRCSVSISFLKVSGNFEKLLNTKNVFDFFAPYYSIDLFKLNKFNAIS